MHSPDLADSCRHPGFNRRGPPLHGIAPHRASAWPLVFRTAPDPLIGVEEAACNDARVEELLSDSVPDDERAAYGGLALASLDLLALFDRLLDVMDWFTRDSLTADPALGAGQSLREVFATTREGDKGK